MPLKNHGIFMSADRKGSLLVLVRFWSVKFIEDKWRGQKYFGYNSMVGAIQLHTSLWFFATIPKEIPPALALIS